MKTSFFHLLLAAGILSGTFIANAADKTDETQSSQTKSGENEVNGGAINSAETLTFLGKTSFTDNSASAQKATGATANGGAIYANGTASSISVGLNGTEHIFTKNSVSAESTSAKAYGGAIFSKSGVYFRAGTSLLSNNSASATGSSGQALGGSIYSSAAVTITAATTRVEFINNKAKSQQDAWGGAIHSGSFNLQGGNNYFYGNEVIGGNAQGGAVRAAAAAKISGGIHLFSGNKVNVTTINTRGHGGAIYVNNNSFETSGTSQTTFSGNIVMGTDYAHGGAVYSGRTYFKLAGANNIFENNKAEVTGNFADLKGGAAYSTGAFSITTGAKTSEFKNNSLIAQNANLGSAQGGAIYVNSTLSISSGTNIFSNNTISATNLDASKAQGGAIYANGKVTFSGNTTSVTFTGNKVNGQANDIYSTKNGFAFSGKGTYSFDGGIIAAGTTGTLTVSTGSQITFHSGAISEITGLTTLSSTSATKQNTSLNFESGSTSKLNGGLKITGYTDLSLSGTGTCVSVGTSLAISGTSNTLYIGEGAQLALGSFAANTLGNATLSFGLDNAYLVSAGTPNPTHGNALISGGTGTLADSLNITLKISDKSLQTLLAGKAISQQEYSFKLFDGELGKNLSTQNFNLDEKTSSSWKISNFDASKGEIKLARTVIPEPSLFGLFFSLAALALAGTRRKRTSA